MWCDCSMLSVTPGSGNTVRKKLQLFFHRGHLDLTEFMISGSVGRCMYCFQARHSLTRDVCTAMGFS